MKRKERKLWGVVSKKDILYAIIFGMQLAIICLANTVYQSEILLK